MQRRDIGVGRREVRNDLAVLHDIDAVGELKHLVEPVRDEDEGGARFQGAHAAEQNVDLRALQNRGWLVEQYDEMSRSVLLERERLGQLHHLSRGEAELRPRACAGRYRP